VHFLEIGMPISSICKRVGINRDTYYEWMNKGEKEPDTIYANFSDNVKESQFQAELKLLQDIQNDKSWQSKAWIMERRFRDEWAANKEEKHDDNKIKDLSEQIRKLGEVDD